MANRGEIAVRVCRTLRELGIASVAVYSEADRELPFVDYADEAYAIGPGPATESYLRGETIIRTAQRAGAEAIHPGFGFLAENPAFARACAAAGLTFIGPSPDAMEAMASKTAARQAMAAAGVPIVPGLTEPVATLDDARAAAAEIGYPVAVKAAAGGGGKGIKPAAAPDELERAFESAQREGKAYFADDAVYLERYLERPRHVEVQVLADLHGNVIHLGERDCSVQRRHQKILEETPSPAVTPELRERIGAIAVDAARAVGYTNAGTVEGLLDARRLLLLPRDEHPPSGRAHRDGDGDGARPRARAGLDRRRPAAGLDAGRCAPLRPFDPVPDQRRGPRSRVRADPRHDHALPRALGAGRPDRLRRGRGLDDLGPLRPDDREGRRVGRGPRAGAKAHAARPLRARDRGPEDADPAPPPDPRAPGLHRRRPAARVRGGRRRGGGRWGARPRTGPGPGGPRSEDTARRGRWEAVRGDRHRPRGSRAGPAFAPGAQRSQSASGPRTEPPTSSAVRCRARCSPSAWPRATPLRPATCWSSSRR